jgi:shikimate dehydrogenase
MNVKGTTRVVGVFGSPVRHSCSPQMHNAAFAELGLDFIYVPFEVAPEQLRAAVNAVRALDMPGVNVTIPHKGGVAELVDELDESAALLAAVNTICACDGRLIGYNTDAEGFARSLEEAGESLEGADVAIIGAGGGARAVAWAATTRAARSIVLIGRTPPKAAAVADLVNRAAGRQIAKAVSLATDAERSIRGRDIIIDTTSVGMHPHVDVPPVIEPTWISAGQLVVDIVYNPADTVLLEAARQRGARTVSGLGMLVHQGAIAFEMWTGARAPVETMRQALVEALAESRQPG